MKIMRDILNDSRRSNIQACQTCIETFRQVKHYLMELWRDLLLGAEGGNTQFDKTGYESFR